MDVFDFDGTLYSGNASFDFYEFCISKYSAVRKHRIDDLLIFISYAMSTPEQKEKFDALFSWTSKIPDIDKSVSAFWEEHKHKLNDRYSKVSANDIIASASPRFLLVPIAASANSVLVASEVDYNSGKTTRYCYGKTKQQMILEATNGETINCFYSDSRSDDATAAISLSPLFIENGKEPRAWDAISRKR